MRSRACVEQLATTWASLLSLGEELEPADWTRPTRCPGWSVQDQYAHVMGTEAMLAQRPPPQVDIGDPSHVRNDIARFNEAWIVAWRDQPAAELLGELRVVTDERLAALRAMSDEDFAAPSWTPVGQATYGRFMEIRVFDCWVHEQDIRAAVGRPGHDVGPVAEQCVDEIEGSLGYVVGKRAGAADGSRITFDVTGPVARTVDVAVDGRARVVEQLDRAADVTLHMGSGTLVALACGRVEGAAVGDDVVIDGDIDLGRRVIANLTFTM